ncbi:MAG TPA: lysylphosphatidylglycerol synthase transmembrane domain-containing protein [Pyrinomonadaceae bacterium]|nr:lysylphosphatidylglycerol synthase transmembrane domain-containing protein [Pyrinomonadaceae bacterium]
MSRLPRRLRAMLGYALAAVCLYWVLHDLDAGDLLVRVAKMNLFWLAAAILFDMLSYVCQGLRWKLLLERVGAVTTLQTTKAIYTGLFVNEMLPMKLGEIVRAFLISRWTAVKLTTVIPSILLERLYDGIWLAIGIVITILLAPLPRRLVEAGDVFALIILAALLVVALLALARRSADDSSPEKSFPALAQSVARELQLTGLTRAGLLAFVLSLILLLLQGFSFWFVMRAYGLPLTFPVGLAVFIIVHLGTLIPTAPANIGSYQFFTVLGLTLFGVEKTTAAGFSLVVFTVLTIPLWVIGFWAIGSSGLTLLQIRSELATWFRRDR